MSNLRNIQMIQWRSWMILDRQRNLSSFIYFSVWISMNVISSQTESNKDTLTTALLQRMFFWLYVLNLCFGNRAKMILIFFYCYGITFWLTVQCQIIAVFTACGPERAGANSQGYAIISTKGWDPWWTDTHSECFRKSVFPFLFPFFLKCLCFVLPNTNW